MDHLSRTKKEGLLSSAELGAIMERVRESLTGAQGKDLAAKIKKVLDREEFSLPTQEEAGEMQKDLLDECNQMSLLLVQLNTLAISGDGEQRKAIADFLKTLAMREKLVALKIDQISQVINSLRAGQK